LTLLSGAFRQTEQRGQTVYLQIVDTFVLVDSIAHHFGVAGDSVDAAAGRTVAVDLGLSSVLLMALTEGPLAYVAN